MAYKIRKFASNSFIGFWCTTGWLRAVLLLCLVASHAGAAESSKPFALYVDGASVSQADKDRITQKVVSRLKAIRPGSSELKGVRGLMTINAACPIGFVQKANYKFSTNAIAVIKDEGSNCDGPEQCRAWQIEALPENEQAPYDFSLQLQCSADDTLPRRSKAELTGQAVSESTKK